MREKARKIAELMRQLSNENRLLILCALLQKPMTVGELAKEVPNITVPALSQHLQKLRSGGLVDATKQGQYVCYCLKDERLRALMEVLKNQYCSEE